MAWRGGRSKISLQCPPFPPERQTLLRNYPTLGSCCRLRGSASLGLRPIRIGERWVGSKVEATCSKTLHVPSECFGKVESLLSRLVSAARPWFNVPGTRQVWRHCRHMESTAASLAPERENKNILMVRHFKNHGSFRVSQEESLILRRKSKSTIESPSSLFGPSLALRLETLIY